jgi:hypothetical protein
MGLGPRTQNGNPDSQNAASDYGKDRCVSDDDQEKSDYHGPRPSQPLSLDGLEKRASHLRLSLHLTSEYVLGLPRLPLPTRRREQRVPAC